MVWLLLGVTGLLALCVVALAASLVRLRSRIGALEARPATAHATAAPLVAPAAPEFVITGIGTLEEPPDAAPVVATVPATVFADIVAREAVVQTASLVAGLRRALDPETRNRIRFHMRQEVRRSRKQRKLELREVRREWAARQREAAGEAGAA